MCIRDRAEVARRTAKGEADALFAKMEAQARGAQEILVKQAAGMRELVNAAGGNADSACLLYTSSSRGVRRKILKSYFVHIRKNFPVG